MFKNTARGKGKNHPIGKKSGHPEWQVTFGARILFVSRFDGPTQKKPLRYNLFDAISMIQRVSSKEIFELYVGKMRARQSCHKRLCYRQLTRLD
jgi:hypothetical protein